MKNCQTSQNCPKLLYTPSVSAATPEGLTCVAGLRASSLRDLTLSQGCVPPACLELRLLPNWPPPLHHEQVLSTMQLIALQQLQAHALLLLPPLLLLLLLLLLLPPLLLLQQLLGLLEGSLLLLLLLRLGLLLC